MNDLQSARDDLAYLRGVVNGSGQFQAVAGELFIWAGLLYGLQCLGEGLDVVGLVSLPPIAHLVLALAPTAAFVVVLTVVIVRERKAGRTAAGGVASRALKAVFEGAGLANLVLACVFAYGASTTHSMLVWLYHPVVVCMFQGVAWYVAWSIRRELWMGFVAFGWLATTLACGLLVSHVAAFLLTLGAALLLFMALPGYFMMRSSRRSA